MSAPADAAVQFARCLIANLRAGVRLALFLPGPRFQASLLQLLVLIALGWVCAALADHDPSGSTFEVSRWGVALEAARSYFWLAALALVALLDGSARHFLRLAVACASADIVVWTVWLALGWSWPEWAPQRYWTLAWFGAFVWQAAILLRALVLVRGEFRWRAPACAALYAAALYVNVELLPDEPLFLREIPADTEPPLNIEDVYYGQAALLEEQLRAVAPGRPGTVDLFFLGFGGYAGENVFRREVLQVRDIMAARFGTGPRSAVLINNRGTVQEIPLANRPNLAYLLNGIAGRMALQEDILFLFLTSHGREDGQLSVDFWPLGMNDLTAPALRSALDEAGIKWRVLVVSACYSGSFLETLASPTTLVITAAARDKSSFGCAHENRWTYFGEAYFKDALRDTRSFSAAFERARARIQARELAEDKEPSEPQMSLGAEVDAQLKRLAPP